jgi:diadenosine tetraphosphate (Ap4A) HIT family hydrolase
MLADGHLLISPTYHAKSCFQLCPDDAIGLIHLIKEIRNIIQKNTGKTPIFFEHGNPTTCEPHCSTCIEHAHLHVLPFDPGMLPVLQQERRLIGSSPLISNPLSHAQVTEPYIMLVDTNLFLHFFSTDDAPRQYLRHLYARLIGQPELGAWIPNISAEQTITNANHYRALFST